MFESIFEPLFDIAYNLTNLKYPINTQENKYLWFDVLSMVCDDLSERNYFLFFNPVIDSLATIEDIEKQFGKFTESEE